MPIICFLFNFKLSDNIKNDINNENIGYVDIIALDMFTFNDDDNT